MPHNTSGMSTPNVDEYIDLLGKEVKDRITGFKGTLISINFDLFGCVQATVKPSSLDKDGKMLDGQWFDVNRLDIIGNERAMPIPPFAPRLKDHEKGPAEKPATRY